MLGNAYLLLVLATLGWAGNAVAGKLASTEWEPFTLTCVRWFLAFALLMPFAWRHIKPGWEWLGRDCLYLMGLGAFGMALFNLCMYLALHHTTAINVSIEQASMPVMIILLNFIVMSQRTHWLQLVGVALTIFGVLVTATEGQPSRFFSAGLNRGDLIMLLGCVFYAVYTFGLRWRPKVHWMVFMWLVAAGAFLMTIPFALYEINQLGLVIPATKGWLIMLYIVIVPSIACQLAFARGVELIGGNRAGLFINLVPVFGSLLAVLILSEQFRIHHGLGMALVIGGILLAEQFAPGEA